MGDLTDNFSRSELRCRHCGELPAAFILKVKELQKARDYTKGLVTMLGFLGIFPKDEIVFVVESGYRCPEHDRAIGGKGEHVAGAFDINYSGGLMLCLIIAGAFLAGCRRVGVEQHTVHLGFAPSEIHKPWRVWTYYDRYTKKKGSVTK